MFEILMKYLRRNLTKHLFQLTVLSLLTVYTWYRKVPFHLFLVMDYFKRSLTFPVSSLSTAAFISVFLNVKWCIIYLIRAEILQDNLSGQQHILQTHFLVKHSFQFTVLSLLTVHGMVSKCSVSIVFGDGLLQTII